MTRATELAAYCILFWTCANGMENQFLIMDFTKGKITGSTDAICTANNELYPAGESASGTVKPNIEVPSLKTVLPQSKILPIQRVIRVESVTVLCQNSSHRGHCAKCEGEELGTSVKARLNYRTNFLAGSQFEDLDCLQGVSGKLLVQYTCVNEQDLKCDDMQNCLARHRTCISGLHGGKCSCLEIPDKTWNYPVCSGARYLGCHNLSRDVPELRLNVSTHVNPELCIQICQMNGYAYAVLAGISQGCLCQQSVNQSTRVEDSHCWKSCLIDPLTSCGNFPFAHVYNTGIETTAGGPCNKGTRCPNGTYCIAAYDAGICICNNSAVEKNIKCYGCLSGWTSGPELEDCYSVTSPRAVVDNKINATKCANIHGEPLKLKTITGVVYLLRFMMELYRSLGLNERLNETVLSPAVYSGQKGMPSHEPVCQRPKRPVIGKYPWATWPAGTYGLPMPKSGCPLSHGFNWKVGSWTQDSEDDMNENAVSSNFMLNASVTTDVVGQGFCLKTSTVGESTSFPSGRYCVYRKGGSCPRNLLEGEIFWDDEDNSNDNKAEGELPDGMFKSDTVVNFCCSVDPINRSGVVFPRDRPFYLFPYGQEECQPVVGTKVTLEWIQYDLENIGGELNANIAFKGHRPYAYVTNPPGMHLIVYYCYYEPVASCGHPIPKENVITQGMDYTVGSSLNYTCKQGFQNVGDSSDLCLGDEQWSSMRGPLCVDIDECSSGHPCNIKANCYNTEGSYYCKCNPGLKGNGTVCEVITCEDPVSLLPNRGLITKNPESLTTHAKVALACEPGYLLIGKNFSECDASGKWTTFPLCVEERRCLPFTYACVQTAVMQGSTLDSGIYRDCQCQLNGDSGNETVITPIVSSNGNKDRIESTTDPWTYSIITIVVSITVFVGIMVLMMWVVLRKRKKEMQRRKESSLSSGRSVYADIEEFQLDIQMQGSKSTPAAGKDGVDIKPDLPPRNALSKQKRTTSASTSRLFIPSERFAFRRKSDFGSCDSMISPPKHKSSVFGGERSRRFPSHQYETGDVPPTKFKLQSLSQIPIWQRCHIDAPPSPASLTTQLSTGSESSKSLSRFEYPTPEYCSNIVRQTSPILESPVEDEHVSSENPYLAVGKEFCDSDNDNSSEIDSQAVVGNRRNCLPRRHKSVPSKRRNGFTLPSNSTSKSARYQDAHVALMVSRSISLPEDLNACTADGVGEKQTEFSAGDDEVFSSDDPQSLKSRMSTSSTGLQRKDGAILPQPSEKPQRRKSRISVKLKFTADFLKNDIFRRRHEERRSGTELYSRLFRYRVNANRNEYTATPQMRRKRCDTNPV